MRVLFVCSGNSKYFDITPIVKSQADSLINESVNVDVLAVRGKGYKGYWKNIWIIRRKIESGKYDIIHAHYGLCGIISYVALRTVKKRTIKNIPVVVSLMGSDVNSSKILHILNVIFIKKLWDATIVKSSSMKHKLGISIPVVIPNGVDIDVFKPIDRELCRDTLSWKPNDHLILFGADPSRAVKNFSLAKSSYNMLIEGNPKLISMKIELITLGSIPHEIIPLYLNACDVLLLTSMWEGSPNIIKEAMACNIPIVCTDVGDVRWLLDGVDGCYITSQNPNDIADKLHRALSFNKRTTGREKLIQLGLDSTIIAQRIIEIYENVLNK